MMKPEVGQVWKWNNINGHITYDMIINIDIDIDKQVTIIYKTIYCNKDDYKDDQGGILLDFFLEKWTYYPAYNTPLWRLLNGEDE